MIHLDPAQRRVLRAKAHHLHPVVSIGTHGLTPAVLHEIDVNLLAHELIKLRVASGDRGEREALMHRICSELDAAPVQHLGKILVLYRAKPEEEKPSPAPRTRRRGVAAAPRAQAQPKPGLAKRRGRAAESVAIAPQARRTRRGGLPTDASPSPPAARNGRRRAPTGLKRPPQPRRRRG